MRNGNGRIHRSISWIGHAEPEAEDPGAAVMFFWIAFNAAFGGERSSFGARDDFAQSRSGDGRVDDGCTSRRLGCADVSRGAGVKT